MLADAPQRVEAAQHTTGGAASNSPSRSDHADG